MMNVLKTLATPFGILWQLVVGILLLTGRFVALLVGPLLILVGGLLTLTIIGAVVGVPLIWVGVQLIRQGLS